MGSIFDKIAQQESCFSQILKVVQSLKFYQNMFSQTLGIPAKQCFSRPPCFCTKEGQTEVTKILPWTKILRL